MPIHPRDRLALAAKNDDVIFVEQVPLHPRDMLNKKTKILKHPRDRLKGKGLQVTRYNVSAIAEKTFSFLPEKSLTKVVPFDVSKVNEDDEFYVVHEPGTNTFSLRREDEKKAKNIPRDKKYI